MESLPILLGFVLYILYVLIPLIPAIIIYKMFPKTTVGVNGLMGNLKINATGAFAAYIIVVVMGHFIIEKNHDMINNMDKSSWEVTSKIVLTDLDGKKINVTDRNLRETLQVKAMPEWGVKSNSEVVFRAHSVGNLPRIMFSYGRNFESQLVNLADEKFIKNESDHTLDIGTITLKSTGDKTPYKYRPTGATALPANSSNPAPNGGPAPSNINTGMPIPIGSGPPITDESSDSNN